MNIILRDLDDGELEQLFVWEQHPAAVEMAAFTRADPSDRNAFDAHYERIRADPILRDIVEHIYRLESKAVPTPLVRSHEGVVEMHIVTLRGQLMCKNASEIAVVAQFLPAHIELTRAEPGCISFEVNPSDDPSVWSVSEQFQDAASFELHQARVKASEWGRATASIERRYTVTGLGEPWRRTASPSNRDS